MCDGKVYIFYQYKEYHCVYLKIESDTLNFIIEVFIFMFQYYYSINIQYLYFSVAVEILELQKRHIMSQEISV